MALTDESGGIQPTLPLAPAYNGGFPMSGGGFGNGFFGGDSAWLLLLILLCGGGWGGIGGFGMGGMWPAMMMGGGYGIDYRYPWLNNSQNINSGFRDQQMASTMQGIQSAVTSGFGDVQLGIAGVNQNVSNVGAGIQNSLCNGFNSVNQAIAGTAANAETAANSRHSALTNQLYNGEINALNRSFAEQTANQQGFNGVQAQLAQCCCDNRAGLADLKYTVATENCADRAALSDGIRDLLAATQAQTQTILTQLCNDKIEAKNDTIAQLRQELIYARGQASQVDQTAQLRASQATAANQLVSELRSCPIPAQPVYGNQPIFNCNGGGCGCGAV